MSSVEAGGTSRAPSFVSFVNPLIRRLVGAGMPGPNVLLTVRGRTSGVPRTFPVAVVEVHGRRFVQSPFGEVNWVRNLRAAGEAVVSKGRRQETVDAVEISPAEGGPILREALAPYVRSRVLAKVLGRFFDLRSTSTAEEYVAEARRHPMFELRPRTTAR
jgi:deazaflavin-dependent oxidoreductase (nitroreductase family)